MGSHFRSPKVKAGPSPVISPEKAFPRSNEEGCGRAKALRESQDDEEYEKVL
jgi:hypothetical protein